MSDLLSNLREYRDVNRRIGEIKERGKQGLISRPEMNAELAPLLEKCKLLYVGLYETMKVEKGG